MQKAIKIKIKKTGAVLFAGILMAAVPGQAVFAEEAPQSAWTIETDSKEGGKTESAAADTAGSNWSIVSEEETETKKEETTDTAPVQEEQTAAEAEQPAAEQAWYLEEDNATEQAYAIASNYVSGTIHEAGSTAADIYRSLNLSEESLEGAPLGIRVAAYAMSFVGVTPYVWAGGSLYSGTDCSGFTHLIYDHFGIWLPTGSDAYQTMVGTHISYEELMPGDIIVYDNGHHVGIFIGNDMVVHCSSPENGTVCWNMWYRNITAFLRIA